MLIELCHYLAPVVLILVMVSRKYLILCCICTLLKLFTCWKLAIEHKIQFITHSPQSPGSFLISYYFECKILLNLRCIQFLNMGFRERFIKVRPPLWSSGQSSWLQIWRLGSIPGTTRKKCSGSGTGSTQPRENN
jgi:hypothetical protein